MRVLLTTDRLLTLEQVAAITTQLEEKLPDAEFTIASGFTGAVALDPQPPREGFKVDEGMASEIWLALKRLKRRRGTPDGLGLS